MQVETFECEETAAERPEASAEAATLIETLGLEGQRSLFKGGEPEAPPVRIPYPEATDEQVAVYRELCPREYKLAEYARSPIPLRALQVIAHAKECGLFDEIVIWDKERYEIKDPVAVAYTGPSHQRKHYLLARWGETLDEFPALRRQAIAAKRERLTQAARQCASEATQEAAKIEGMADDELLAIKQGPWFHHTWR